MNYLVEKLSDYIFDKEKLEDLSNQLYYFTNHLTNDYPKHNEWFYNVQLPGVLNSEREILFIKNHENIAGISFLKKTEEEKKICTFYVAEHSRNMGVARTLMAESLKYLETTKPLLTMPREKVQYFLRYIHTYDWKVTQIIDGYYVNNIDEVVFNGTLN